MVKVVYSGDQQGVVWDLNQIHNNPTTLGAVVLGRITLENPQPLPGNTAPEIPQDIKVDMYTSVQVSAWGLAETPWPRPTLQSNDPRNCRFPIADYPNAVDLARWLPCFPSVNEAIDALEPGASLSEN